MPRIFDNIEEHLGESLVGSLDDSKKLDSSIGYFNIRGWSELADAVDSLPESDGPGPKVRLLIGMAGRPDAELRKALKIAVSPSAMDNKTADRLREEAMSNLAEQLVWGLPTAKDEVTIRQLRRQLSEGEVKVKLHLRHPLHAKLYLCHRVNQDNPRTGYVGSSNLTLAGLVRQGELNVDVLDHDATEKLYKWFDARWKDPFSVDVTELLIEVLDASWAAEKPIDPYLIYLKMAYHLSREARDGLVEYGLPDSMAQQLLEYQAAAVKVASRIMIRRGGVMIGDVVGLGKTIVATAIALLMQEDLGTETLVICPKNLVEMWEGYFHEYRVHGKVMSLSMVTKDLKTLRRHRVVIIDESHNLRNPKRQDYGAVKEYLELNESKVVLLTATPYNKEYLDVAGQLGLFIDGQSDLGLQPDRAIGEQGLDAFLTKFDGRLSSLDAFRKSEESEDWQKLMSLFLVRRTRKFIQENYAKKDADGRDYLTFANGEKFFFPDREARTIPHLISAGDPAAEMTNEETFDVLDSLRLPRYGLARYINGSIKPTKDESEVLQDLGKARGNLLGITRTMLYKRLSSCSATFICSLERHLVRNRIALSSITEGKKFPVGRFDEGVLIDEDPEVGLPDGVYPAASDEEAWVKATDLAYKALSGRPPKSVRWIRPALLLDTFREDLEADIAAIQGLLIRFGQWDQSLDTKIDGLVALLSEEYPDQKVLIFTEYQDTADYVLDALEARGILGVRMVSGASKDPTREARAFSPHSNLPIGGMPSGMTETRILVATDVLSEGQNLQDCHVVVNFDLPWAIIRLIQRAGRVDRVGQRSSSVYLHTFLPNDDVDSVINLRGRIKERLQQNAIVFGADEKFFGDASETAAIRDLYSGKVALEGWDEANDEVDWVSVAYEIWRKAIAADPRLVAKVEGLSGAVYSTMEKESVEGALVYVQSSLGFDALAFTNTGGESKLLTPYEALRLAHCVPGTPAAASLPDHHDLVRQAVTGPLQSPAGDLEGSLTGVRKSCWNRLSSYRTQNEDTLFDTPMLKSALDALYRRPLKESATQKLSKALRERTPQSLADLLVALHEDDGLCVAVSDIADDDLQVVCSLGFRTEG
jgi:superfamily II DNA or RNA helicase